MKGRRITKRILRLAGYLCIPTCMLVAIVFYIFSLSHTQYKSDTRPTSVGEIVTDTAQKSKEELLANGFTSDQMDTAPCKITILDVGQALCCIIQSGNECMVFDGGDRDTSSKVVAFCKENGIAHINYLVASHFHSDHVYGLIGLIRSGIDYDCLIAPDYETDSYSKTALMQQVEEEKRYIPYEGQRLSVGDVKVRCIAPVSDAYSDDNGYSVGYIIEYQGVRILIDGDATAESETDMLDASLDIDADILIVPHHGSTYSSSQNWLDRVSPQTAIISCGADNEYYHPHEATLERLKACGVSNLYRTDLNGDITIRISDTGNYQVGTQKRASERELWLPGNGPVKEENKLSELWDAKNDKVESYYIGNVYSKKFHRPSCGQLPKENRRKILSDRESALQEGYIPCGACNP